MKIKLTFSLLAMLTTAISYADWSEESPVFKPKTSIESSCISIPNTSNIVCVFTLNSGYYLDLYYRISRDGGLTFDEQVHQITHDPYDEYDPFLAFDHTRGKILMTYSKTGGNGDDLLLKKASLLTSTGILQWEEEVVIVDDTDYHWDASILVLNNGNYLVFETLNGPEVNLNGEINVYKSLDGGNSWPYPPVAVTPNTTIHEEQPVAIQQEDGVIRLFYREWPMLLQPNGDVIDTGADSHGGLGSDIWQIWSEDNGDTWIGNSIFYSTEDDDLFSFVGTQGGDNVTVMFIGTTDEFKQGGSDSKKHAVYLMQSSDKGLSFEPPAKISDSTWREWRNIDPHFTIGCRGFFANYNAAYPSQEVLFKRYDWGGSNCP